MQTEYLLDPVYYQIKKARVSCNDPEALRRWEAVERFEHAMLKGLSAVDAARVVGIPKATLYRWKKKKTKRLDDLCSASRRPKTLRKPKDKSALSKRIQELREEFPTWGKRKLTQLLLREKITAKESTVGRIISALIKRGVIPSAKLAAQRAGARPKPRRPFAIRLKRGQRLRGESPGDVVQIDHMSVAVSPGFAVKHFNAVCTFSRWNYADAFSAATARTATMFIDALIEKSPFPIRSIQVDGGSEFMADFEAACDRHNISLAVLAPKSPELNGHVERINGTWRSDFYQSFDLPSNLTELRPLLENYNDTYNWDRPHEGLALQTPQEFLETLGFQIPL